MPRVLVTIRVEPDDVRPDHVEVVTFIEGPSTEEAVAHAVEHAAAQVIGAAKASRETPEINGTADDEPRP